MAVDKKNVNGQIRLILLHSIGVATLPIDIDKNLLLETLNTYGRIWYLNGYKTSSGLSKK